FGSLRPVGFDQGSEDDVNLVGEDGGGGTARARQDSSDLVGCADREVPHDALVGDPARGEGQHQTDRDHPRGQRGNADAAATCDEAEGEECDVERQQDRQCGKQRTVAAEQAPERGLSGGACGAIDGAQARGNADADPFERLLAGGRVPSAASQTGYGSSASSALPGQARPVGAGYQSPGGSPSASRSRSRRRTALSRPERIVSASGGSGRSRRPTTLASGWRTRKQRLCAGSERISESSWAVRPKPSQ